MSKIKFQIVLHSDWLLEAELQQWIVQLMVCASVEQSLQELSE